ncbi:hypothetical protein [Paracraurococcus ruber]|uniref:hypothetical protein n=1 Tax=Paracraurococcus ruber TaxID=77675 RepID=UPI0010576323|nr:hypothetical protein [Paracraurococcus ruber]TDG19766.1 hypothetical protein E2C05_27415 [Paracraurococcus ruber]
MIGVSVGDAFKAIEFLFKGIQLYVAADRRLFVDHIEPCFKKLELIQADYQAQLVAISRKLDETRDTGSTARFVQEASAQLRAQRLQLHELAKRWAANETRNIAPEVRSFYEAVKEYLNLSDVKTGGVRRSVSQFSNAFDVVYKILKESDQINKTSIVLEKAQAAIYINNNKLASDLLLERVQEIQELAELRWRGVASAYAEAQISLLR